MAHIYIALVDTPGFFASLIRHYLGQKYVHVVRHLMNSCRKLTVLEEEIRISR